MAENVAVEQNPKTAALIALANVLKQENPVWVTQIVDALDEVTVFVPRENIVDVCWFLKTRHQFDMLMDLNGNDLGAEEDPRFEVIYHLFSTKTYQRIRLKVLLSDEDPHVNTVTTVWRTADWHERETYDMFGVIFDGHPDLRRILLPSDFDGHALRKDYPLRGFEPYSLS
ncbi:MAG TPA: NADH-quinone oxidoreductase subunit C [Pyrinomonadaceae bacterium]|jgi:NADH-quinone oxidoreductase subunit C